MDYSTGTGATSVRYRTTRRTIGALPVPVLVFVRQGIIEQDVRKTGKRVGLGREGQSFFFIILLRPVV